MTPSRPSIPEPAPPGYASDGRMSLEDLPEAALRVDSAGVIVAANRLAGELFGTPLAQLLRRPLGAVLPVAERPAREVAPGRCTVLRAEARRANGVPLTVDVGIRSGAAGTLLLLRELSAERLTSTAQRYLDVAFDTAPIGMALFNTDGEYVRVNAALCRLLDRPAQDLLGRRDNLLTHPDDRQSDVDAAWRILNGEISTWQCEKRFVRPDGSIVWAIANLTFLRDEAGRPLSWLGQFQDITRRRQAEEALREAEERFRSAFSEAPIGVAIMSLSGHRLDRFLHVNKALCRISGRDAEELRGARLEDVAAPAGPGEDGEPLAALVSGEVPAAGLRRRLRRAGSSVPVDITVSLVAGAGDAPGYAVAQFEDATERWEYERRLRHLADHDELTGLFNRRRLQAELESAVARARRDGGTGALLLLDIDGFKAVNDTHGHPAGDRLLRAVGTTLARRLRRYDVVGRLGGDEFAIILPDTPAHEAETIAARVLDYVQAVREHVTGTSLDVSASVGIAMFGAGDHVDPRALLVAADVAMYEAKAAGRGRWSRHGGRGASASSARSAEAQPEPAR